MAFTAGQLHVSRPLTKLVVAYDPNEDELLHNWFFPNLPVDHRTDLIRQRSKADMLRLYDLKKADVQGKPARVQMRMDTSLSYLAQPYIAEAVIDHLEAQDADAEVQYEQQQTMAANLAVQMSVENDAITILRNASILIRNTTLVAAQQWDNFASPDSQPIVDLMSAVRSVEMKTGKKVNRIGMSKPTWDALAQNPLSRESVDVTNQSGRLLTPEILEKALNVEPGSIKISRATYNSAAWGQTPSYKSFIGADVVVARVEDPKVNSFGLGYEFSWGGYGTDSAAVIRYQDMSIGAGADIAKVIRVLEKKVTNPEAAFLIKAAVSTAFDATL